MDRPPSQKCTAGPRIRRIIACAEMTQKEAPIKVVTRDRGAEAEMALFLKEVRVKQKRERVDGDREMSNAVKTGSWSDAKPEPLKTSS